MLIYKLPHYCHPLKDDAWFEAEKARSTEDEFAREILISYEYSVGNIVFKEFRSSHILHGPWAPNPDLPVIRYMDYGRVNATLFAQKDNRERIVFFHEIVLEKSNTDEQGYAVQAYSAGLDCTGFIDYDDPAGSNKDHRSDTTDVEIMETYGINPTHAVSKSDSHRRKNRISLTQLLLSKRIAGEEIIQVHESMKVTIDAFQSGYRYKMDIRGETLDIIQEEHPYEDVMDCLCGTLLETFSVQQGTPKVLPKRQVQRNRYTGYGR